MGVYIKGVHKPKSCQLCTFNTGYHCRITCGKIDWVDDTCDIGCPIIEIFEPHGDLVDIDAIKIDKNIFTENMVVHAPMLIPAEGKQI